MVVKPGLLTTVQDLGRWGLQSSGVGVGGPMDPFAHRLANALVGNKREAATLEITLLGPELEFDDQRALAVAGAEFDVTIDDRRVAFEKPFVARRGSRLRFGARRSGSRAYLAVQGGLAVSLALGSRATHLGNRLGGISGRALVAGDRVPLGEAGSVRLDRNPETKTARDRQGGRARLRFLPGPDTEKFRAAALDVLQSGPYTVGRDSDRMGFRLEGPSIPLAREADIISDVTPLGVLQVPASGQPVMLMADRQTTGGYARLATVIAADISVAGQLAPGDAISFAVCSRREALAALIAQERILMAVEATRL